MVKMSGKEKKQKKKKVKCFADFIEQVPKVITNEKHGTQYEQLHFIGSGSYGKCFEVVKLSTKERFACKVLSKVLIQDAEFTGLVQNEISIHRKLKHQHVVEFVKSFEDDNLIYMIQALCSNHSLRDLHKARGVVSLAECRYFISQILKGAQYIHEKKYIHRDLKLTNILIDKNMQMKICDFGLAIHLNDPRLDTKTICGTTNYLAPEVVARKGFACVSDVWAIGVITFVLMFGYKPFEECDAYATHQRILRGDYKVPSNTDSDLKIFLRNVFERDVEYRSSAEECLKSAFFRKFDIPDSLPFEAFSRATETESYRPPSCTQIKAIDFSRYSDDNKTMNIEYPAVHVTAKPMLKKSYEHAKHAYALDKAFNRLNSVCRYIQIDPDYSFSDLSSSTDEFKPEFWIAKWSYDRARDSGFAYQMSDGSTGILFHEGLRLMRAPDGTCFALESGDERFWRIRGQFSQLDRQLEQFNMFENMMQKNGIFVPETIYNTRRTTYLYTWLQTDSAVIMLLSNNTIQINFMHTHKKVIVSMEKQKITFVTGRMTVENFKTVDICALINRGFSLASFSTFKSVAAIIQYLAEKLKQA